jgi:organic radical activating enzyme
MSDKARTMRDRLNAVSPSFCLAKWYQVTIHLQNGHTHSCHHPHTHKVPLEEVAANPSALHNTSFKKQRRREMLEGVRPAECDYCWNVEDASADNLSDRHLKSAEWWEADKFYEARSLPWDADVNPTYVEVSFGNACNFKCSYCSPDVSSKWMEEIKRFGPYPTSQRRGSLEHAQQRGKMPIPEREENPYVEAFWRWWPELYRTLRVFRVTGGEPLLNKNTFMVLDHVLAHPNPDLHLSINTNLGVPDDVYGRFLDLVRAVVERRAVASFHLYSSVDAHGRRAEYIRHGLDYDTWIANARQYFEAVPDSQLTIMSTFNALSLTSFIPMLKDVLELRKAYRTTNDRTRIVLDLPYLRDPEHQSAMILGPAFDHAADEMLAFVIAEPSMLDWERNKVARIHSMMRTRWPDDRLARARADFYRFFAEHDRRRATSFVDTFPEMERFWQLCRGLAEADPI